MSFIRAVGGGEDGRGGGFEGEIGMGSKLSRAAVRNRVLVRGRPAAGVRVVVCTGAHRALARTGEEGLILQVEPAAVERCEARRMRAAGIANCWEWGAVLVRRGPRKQDWDGWIRQKKALGWG